MEQISPKLKSWASILEPKTRAQAARMASHTVVWPHMALLPDAHLGKGACVGSAIPTRGAIMPAAVGVDIGCGMVAVRTQFSEAELRARGSLTPLREAIERRVPVSAGGYNTRLTETAGARLDYLTQLASDAGFRPADYAKNWEMQLGSLGSGNHFIEVTVDEDSRVWLFLHSGSRGVGNKIAQHHINVARAACAGVALPDGDQDLAYLTEGTDEFDAYVRELKWAQEFARLNREEMMDRVVEAAESFLGAPVFRSEEINCHHNYTEEAVVDGEPVWLSRKGAINAERGVLGLIPGSMGTRSYVVRGLGNEESLNTAPHGAGRNYSRNAAKRTFTMEDLEAAMEGIEFRHTDAFLDEHPLAYKDIDVIMEDARDLVEIVHEFRQIVNVKGD